MTRGGRAVEWQTKASIEEERHHEAEFVQGVVKFEPLLTGEDTCWMHYA